MILALLAAVSLARAEPPRGSINAAWSGGPSRMYGFVEATPVIARHDGASLGLRVTSSFLRYEVVDARQQSLRVDSPGLALAAAFAYAPGRLSIDIATGAEGRRTLRDEAATGRLLHLDLGVTLAVSTLWRPDPRLALSASGSFTGANNYFYGSAGARRQVVPLFRHDPPTAFWLGVDASAQGNHDLRSIDGAALAEITNADWKLAFNVRSEFGVQDVGGARRPTARLGCGLYRWF